MNAPIFYFKDERLGFTLWGRFVVRLVGFLAYSLTASAALVFLLSEIRALNALGVLLILFFLDQAMHWGKARRSLAKRSMRHPNIKEYSDPATLRLLETAADRAQLFGGDMMLHLIGLLLKRSDIKKALQRLEVSPEEFRQKIQEYLERGQQYKPTRKELLYQAEKIMKGAFDRAVTHFGRAVEPHDLLAGIAQAVNDTVDRLLALFEIDAKDLESALIFSRSARSGLSQYFHPAFRLRQRGMNRSWTATPTPVLDMHSIDLTSLARAGVSGFLIGHGKEYGRLEDILARSGNPHALLIGDPGVGKEAIVRYLAFSLLNDRVPAPLFDKRLVALEISSVVAGAKEGTVEERLTKIIEEVERSGNVILYIPEIHLLLKSSSGAYLSAADVLLPALGRNQFSVIGATYPKEYKQYIEVNSEFQNTFEPIRVEEVTEQEAVDLLIYQSLGWEKEFKLIITFGAVKKAVNVAHKYFRQKLLPTSAGDLLREVVAAAGSEGKNVITAADVVAIAQKRINIPLNQTSTAESAHLLNLEEEIHATYINQEEAVHKVANALREYRSGLTRSGAPIASFLFVGPTGVGKTELSKIVAKIQFNSAEAMSRFDMSEYQTKESIYRLIGNPSGEGAGMLTDAVREKPYQLILLDEFEKAHPDILNLFLQVFDDGRLTDSLGRTVNFENTIIIATSNAHSQLIKEELEKGATMNYIGGIVKKRLTEQFRPELLNRFSQIVIFKTLSWEETVKIAALNLKAVGARLMESHQIKLEFSESAVQAVATLGFDPVYGARPLRIVIEEKIKAVLAEKILTEEVKRADTLQVSYQDGQFFFTARQ